MSTDKQCNNKHCIQLSFILLIDWNFFSKEHIYVIHRFPIGYWHLGQITQLCCSLRVRGNLENLSVCSLIYALFLPLLFWTFLAKREKNLSSTNKRWGFTSLNSLSALLSKASEFSAEICWSCSFPPLLPMYIKKLLEKNLTNIYWLPPLWWPLC